MPEDANLLDWLEQLYLGNGDDDGAHDRGFSIQTIDNPGWLVKADLAHLNGNRALTERVVIVLGDPPGPENGNIGGAMWLSCQIRSGQFIGAGDPTQLRAILAAFRRLVEEEGK